MQVPRDLDSLLLATSTRVLAADGLAGLAGRPAPKPGDWRGAGSPWGYMVAKPLALPMSSISVLSPDFGAL